MPKMNEEILQDDIGNFKDCIHELVRNAQMYIDQFYKEVPYIYPEVIRHSGIYTNLISFLFHENNNILKNKGIAFVIDSYELIERKYSTLIDRMNMCINMSCNAKFLVNLSALNNMKQRNTNLSWIISSFDVYDRLSEKKMDNDGSYHLVEHMEKMFMLYDESSEQDTTTDLLTAEEMIKVINNAHVLILPNLENMFKLSENVNSVYATTKIMQKMIEAMVISYNFMKNIKVIRLNESNENNNSTQD